ncbi:cyclase family protein [Frankia sp. AgPm24]|uniref:cyclase family protein n=1 Tax=Frankia sp. AgPm24 TaxID=631128 RepID=UPI00200D733D|nr:cyclase family protein [Frankia sp. AgPm24]MCK9923942.1 cyclase family protein [Frankia sp. AgPm24]
MTSDQAPLPTQDDVLGYFDSLSNWGRWGDDDQLGTLNHINAESRLRAAAAVRHGISVSCAWEVQVGPGVLERATHAVPRVAELSQDAGGRPTEAHDHGWGFSAESLTFTFHGGAYTHVDSLSHIFWNGTMYNGRGADLVDPRDGATWGAVTAAADGMVTRGILLDIPAVRGVDALEPGEPVVPADLEAAERRQNVRVQPGDAVLLRTGHGRRRHATGSEWAQEGSYQQAGWHAACLPWLRERDVAYIGADTAQDVNPSGYAEIFMPVHAVGLVAMGLWLVDNCDLEACASTAARLKQWDFQLSVCPVRFAGTSGSPVNPIATF